jgi:ATP-binding cassette subfamily B protein
MPHTRRDPSLALIDTGLTIGIRWVSAKVGEGLIFDMRAQVFEHIQKMPIAFFTRTQTGALISRLNNDVIGAQQAFTDTLSSVVSNLISVALVLIVMFCPVVADHGDQPGHPAGLRVAGQAGRTPLVGDHRESYALNAQMNNTMNERFNVSGALLVKLFGRPKEERDEFEQKAGRVRDIGVTQAMYARFFIAALTSPRHWPPPWSTAGAASRWWTARLELGRWWPWPPTSPGCTARSPPCPTCRSTS